MNTNLKLKENILSVCELDKLLEIEQIKNYQNREVTSIENDSRNVIDGSLFVAIRGYKVDGHHYINQAINNGAKVIVGEKDLDLREDISYIRVKNSRQALAKLANRFFSYPEKKLNLIGITGSAGKTTTTFMIDNVINQIEVDTGLIGTLYTKIGGCTYENPQGCTTPDALTLNQSLAKMREQGVNYATMEVSSHALKLDRVNGLEFEVAIFTNLSKDHLNFHQDLNDYYKSKELLFKNLARDKFAILNADDKYYHKFKASTQANVYSYGLENRADVTATEIDLKAEGISFVIKLNRPLKTKTGKIVQPTELKIDLRLLGEQNIYNALATFLTGLVFDIPLTKIKQGLESFTGVKRRMELVYNQEFVIIDDFAHNPISLESNFKTLERLDYNKLVIIHFLKGKRGVEANISNAALISSWKEKINLAKIITTQAKGDVIDKNKVLAKEETAFNEEIAKSGIELVNTERLDEALEVGFKSIDAGDILLLLGGPGLDRAQELIKERLNKAGDSN